MPFQTYSASYLQGVQTRRKQAYVELLIQNVIGEIEDTAAKGHTSYMIEQRNVTALLSTEELIAELRIRFPGCNVNFQEVWVDTHILTKELKRGFVIDWSA